jgi:hypothetical protein
MQRAGKKIAAIAQPMGFRFISSRLIVGFIRTAPQHSAPLPDKTGGKHPLQAVGLEASCLGICAAQRTRVE